MIAKKSLGQNFLYDKNIVRKIVKSAEVKPGDLVLEIGPGQGILTEALLEAGAQVIAVEMDEDLIEPLKEKFGDKIKLIQGDILAPIVWDIIRKITTVVGATGRSPLQQHQPSYSVVANIPYNITSPILETLFRAEPKPSRLTLMVQREVADRILAVPPKTSVLSIACQLYAKGKKMMQVSRGSFRPAPKIDSTVIRLDLYPFRNNNINPENILKIVKAGFSARRKQLHGNLAKAGICSSEKTKEILKKMGLSEKSRAENLRVEDWVEFYRMVGGSGIEGKGTVEGDREGSSIVYRLES